MGQEYHYAGQTEISGDSVGGGAAEVLCEWCDNPSTASVELKRRIKGSKIGLGPTGQFLYYCADHKRVALKTATPARSLAT